MTWCYREPTLTEILSDPIVGSLMKADGVDPRLLEATLRSMAATRTSRGWGRLCVTQTSPDGIGQDGFCLVPPERPEEPISDFAAQ
jgi:hypothetical protein